MSPMRPKKVCATPGCGRLTDARHCAQHAHDRQRRLDAARPSAAARGYGADWRALRKEMLARDPVCRLCREKKSKHVDHIVPKSRGGSDHPTNLQGTCHSCHSRKTATQDSTFARPHE